MNVRLKQAWKHWSIGHVFPDMPDGVAGDMMRRGIVEEVTEDKPKRRAGMRAGADYVTR